VADATVVSAGGLIDNYGVESGAIIYSGGVEDIPSGGVDSRSTISSGGAEYVGAGGSTVRHIGEVPIGA